MKPIFSRGPSLQIRLILAVLVALGIIIADSRLGTFSQIRTYMDTAVSPFYFVSNAPRELLDGVSQTLASRDQLELENRALRQELLLKNSELLMLGQYKQENARLRELLGQGAQRIQLRLQTRFALGNRAQRHSQWLGQSGWRRRQRPAAVATSGQQAGQGFEGFAGAGQTEHGQLPS